MDSLGDQGCTGWATVATGVKTVHWISVGVLLEQLGVCWSSTELMRAAPGVKMIHWIGVGVLWE
jgi:hypothetical protein